MRYPGGTGGLYRGDRFAPGAQSFAREVVYDFHAVPDPLNDVRADYVNVRLPGGEPLVIGEAVTLETPGNGAFECVVAEQRDGPHRYRLTVMVELAP
jgi:hypothetical protein